MKYSRLTKEQFEALHQEFSNFLASQKIDKKEWDIIKEEKPNIAEQELDIFSDLIWEGVLQNTAFLEHFSKQHIFLIQCLENEMESIILKTNIDIDFTTQQGLLWLDSHLSSDDLEIIKGSKKYSKERNLEIFELIKQGANISKGEIYNKLKSTLK